MPSVRDLEQRIAILERMVSKLPMRMATPGGGNSTNMLPFEIVDELPAIPTSGIKWVFWTSTSPGTGDDQVWEACEEDAEWSPQDKLTTKDGTPAS